MIIKDKLFHIPACQAMSCAFYYPAGVFLHEVAIPESSSCTQGLVRRWPGFVKLDAYQASGVMTQFGTLPGSPF